LQDCNADNEKCVDVKVVAGWNLKHINFVAVMSHTPEKRFPISFLSAIQAINSGG